MSRFLLSSFCRLTSGIIAVVTRIRDCVSRPHGGCVESLEWACLRRSSVGGFLSYDATIDPQVTVLVFANQRANVIVSFQFFGENLSCNQLCFQCPLFGALVACLIQHKISSLGDL